MGRFFKAYFDKTCQYSCCFYGGAEFWRSWHHHSHSYRPLALLFLQLCWSIIHLQMKSSTSSTQLGELYQMHGYVTITTVMIYNISITQKVLCRCLVVPTSLFSVPTALPFLKPRVNAITACTPALCVRLLSLCVMPLRSIHVAARPSSWSPFALPSVSWHGYTTIFTSVCQWWAFGLSPRLSTSEITLLWNSSTSLRMRDLFYPGQVTKSRAAWSGAKGLFNGVRSCQVIPFSSFSGVASSLKLGRTSLLDMYILQVIGIPSLNKPIAELPRENTDTIYFHTTTSSWAVMSARVEPAET